MHEFSLLADLMRKIEAVAREQGAKKVGRVKIKLGALAHISREHFREHFVRVAQGTIAEGACLDIEVSSDQSDAHAQEILLDSVTVED